MQNKTIFFLIGSFLFLLIGVTPISGAQYGITIGATAEASGQSWVWIPNGTYHVSVSVDHWLGSTTTATCESSILSIAVGGGTLNPHTFESVVTINTTANYSFTATVHGSTGWGYYANFVIILTDLNVQTLTKTSTIGSAPYGLEIIGLALIAVTLVYMKRHKSK